MRNDFNSEPVEISLEKKTKCRRHSANITSLCDYLVPFWPSGKPVSVPNIKSLIRILPEAC